jgi:hypothetical protein
MEVRKVNTKEAKKVIFIPCVFFTFQLHKFSQRMTIDGEAYGRTVKLEREIRNMPPVIAEGGNFNFDGRVWTYQVNATDADGDPLTYSLKSAPQGMTVGSGTGLIKWEVPPSSSEKPPWSSLSQTVMAARRHMILM